ncbi:RNA-binding cell elongation regulator Jag/EloR [Treponema phagedenis]|uniref:RNA-binding protein KhpB n=1 Tax=Treponema phagedenis TaxID=162 RepID=A0AAE6M8Q9_TREPH|nr:RNA-binding cell elongation regulator Jag/EloR [Treponema phagedenis]QEJ97907.1 protein jag [Treponema phagedenis]QSH93568.1 protein jag [Treponema phagedenis]
MTYEFEGKNERDAIDIAVAELGLEKDQFDVEIIEIQKGSLFKKGFAKIRVHVDESVQLKREDTHKTKSPAAIANTGEATEDEKEVMHFLSEIIERMGYEAKIELSGREDKRPLMRIISDNSSILIGKKARTLDSLQFLANVYASKIKNPGFKVMLDCENYRIRREETLVRLAYNTADKVAMSKNSILLEPMNPYERRLIHTALSTINGIETKSEGNGLYKQVRVSYKGL